MGLTLLPLIWLDPVEHFRVFRWLVLIHALAASTQDVAIDALALRVVDPAQRGRLNGAMQAGMLIGRGVFGGGALVLAGAVGWEVVVLLLVGGIWLPALALPGLKEPRVGRPTDAPIRTLTSDLVRILKRRSTWQLIAFALTAGAAFELTGALAGPLLIDAGLTAATIGAVIGIPVLLAMVAGGLLGGWMADQSNPQRLTRFGVVLFALLTMAMAAVAGWSEVPLPLLFGLLVAFYLAIGIFTAASYALFMNYSRPPLAVTRFSAFMAATSACEAWSVWCGGKLAAAYGYGAAMAAMAGVSLLALLVLPRRSAEGTRL
jgi:MFS transporter (putative signal transducer)